MSAGRGDWRLGMVFVLVFTSPYLYMMFSTGYHQLVRLSLNSLLLLDWRTFFVYSWLVKISLYLLRSKLKRFKIDAWYPLLLVLDLLPVPLFQGVTVLTGQRGLIEASIEIFLIWLGAAVIFAPIMFFLGQSAAIFSLQASAVALITLTIFAESSLVFLATTAETNIPYSYYLRFLRGESPLTEIQVVGAKSFYVIYVFASAILSISLGVRFTGQEVLFAAGKFLETPIILNSILVVGSAVYLYHRQVAMSYATSDKNLGVTIASDSLRQKLHIRMIGVALRIIAAVITTTLSLVLIDIVLAPGQFSRAVLFTTIIGILFGLLISVRRSTIIDKNR